MYPFNPNFLSDYKAYILGLSSKELQRLRKFRVDGKHIRTATEFQVVTGISDSLFTVLEPYFRFPQQKFITATSLSPKKTPDKGHYKEAKSVIIKIDLNKATAEQLRQINGIGPKLSQRIVKFRDKLGGFMVKEQLYDVYALEKNVAEKAFQQFVILEKPNIKKLNLNTATQEELAAFTYFNWELAERIVAFRTEAGAIRSFDELPDITGFSIDKIDRIKLYLYL
ncbi:MAG: helix-hairpin-helix domain-containing protein [Bacteroidota bacterium]